MVVVFFGIMDFVVTACPLQIDLVHQAEIFHQQNHTKNSGIIWLGSAELACLFLDFLQSHRAAGFKETLENGCSVACDAKPLASEKFQDAFLGERGVEGMRVGRGHRGVIVKNPFAREYCDSPEIFSPRQ